MARTLLLALLALAGCQGLSTYRIRWVEDHPATSPQVRDAILRGTIVEGMTKEEVEIAFAESLLWSPCPGIPDRSFHEVDSSGILETWVFDRGDRVSYLFFQDGILRSWSTYRTSPPH